MNFYFPDHRALCLAENATHNLHNLLTLRGAQVRDPRIWSRYLSEAMELFARRSDVAFASHHWPTWGSDNIVTYLAEQRDLYAYLHDQTLRLMNQGYVGTEIAEMIETPPGLDAAWHTHGYYGSTSHNVKAIYQRYLGWYDGNPAHLWLHPPVAAAERYVQVIGGVDATVAKAISFLEKGDLRFAAELASHAVFAAPDSETARQVLCTALTELGYGSECATWRNCFLIGAQELFHAIEHTEVSSAGMAPALTVTQLFDSIAIRINGPKAWNERLRINWTITGGGGSDEGYRMELSNGALIHFPTTLREEADLTVTLTKAQLIGLLLEGRTDGVDMSGDAAVLATLVGLIDSPDPDFAVVTP
jgi:alkyl sulfatase BDS1-like metallo-beta-lactamase superfamily hydrolase